MENISVRREDMENLIRDVGIIKRLLLSREKEETELSDWAKEELGEARKRASKKSHEEVKKAIFSE